MQNTLQRPDITRALFAKLCEQFPDIAAQLAERLSADPDALHDTSIPPFPPLEQITRPTVPTEQASYYLDRRPQTMRGWACLENGPIRPVRINGRLAWKVSDLRRVLGVA